MANYAIPAKSLETEYEIKKSRFIARVAYASDRASAMALLTQAKADYPDARHHCWAYLLGNPQSASSAAMSDDGEPSGTAGKPILNVLQHKNVGDVMLIVIRYFGGIKLGAGGLVRAYSTAAQQAMEQLEIQEQVCTVDLLVFLEFSQEQLLRHWLSTHQGQVTSAEYGNCVRVRIAVPEMELETFESFALSQRWKLDVEK
ncbi:MAG: YigZ family protein [Cellvibrionaceae bacterium]